MRNHWRKGTRGSELRDVVGQGESRKNLQVGRGCRHWDDRVSYLTIERWPRQMEDKIMVE